jgi:rod shape determining protein RodA
VLILAYPAWEMLHDYQQRRILVLLDPESDPRGSGYHITQSKIAVGSGELFGKGYRQGTQTQLEFLPEHTTDFVFSVLAEEWGFVGCVTLLGLFFGLFASMLRIAGRARDMFACLVAFGITAQVFAHVVINIGMVIGLLPVVGIPLPLVSYGGSSMLSIMFGLGIVQGIGMRRLQFRAG